MQKTKFVDRLWKIKPTIRIYDLDGTIIDSSHRRATKPNGEIDLDKWRENNTRDYIFKDELLPMYWQLVNDYKNGDIVVICTARELNKCCLLYTSPSPRDCLLSRMPSSA